LLHFEASVKPQSRSRIGVAHGCNAGANARRGLRKNAGSPGQKRNVQMMGARIREKGGIAFLTGGPFNAPGRGREPGAPRRESHDLPAAQRTDRRCPEAGHAKPRGSRHGRGIGGWFFRFFREGQRRSKPRITPQSKASRGVKAQRTRAHFTPRDNPAIGRSDGALNGAYTRPTSSSGMSALV
jgi:hypothetical protein